MGTSAWVAAVAFGSGTILALAQSQIPHRGVIVAIACIALVSLRQRETRVTGWLLLGIAWAALCAETRLSGRLPGTQHNSDAQLRGTVIGIVERHDDVLAFRLRTATQTVALRWYEYPPAQPPPVPGEVWQLRVRLRVPRGFANPGQPRYERFAFRNGIDATGYVREGAANRRGQDTSGWRLDRLRNDLSRRLQALLGNSTATGLIIALAVADRQYLEPAHWRVMRRTGLSHLLAISGLHIGLIAVIAYRSGALLGSLVNRSIGCACSVSLVSAIGYAALAGFSVPTQRALVVVITLLGSRWLRRNSNGANTLGVALLVILAIDPLATLDRGFWLSFGAVACIWLVTSGQMRLRALRGALDVQRAVTVGLAPLMIVLFGEVSLIAPLLNLVAVPLAGLVLVPAILAGVVLYAVWQLDVLSMIARVLDACWPILAALADYGLVAWTPGPVPLGVSLIAVCGAAWLLMPAGWPSRWLGIVMLVPLMTWRPGTPQHGEFELTVLDVGHGLAVTVRTAHHVLLYDAGPLWRSGNDAASRIVIPFLEQLRATPETVVVSHGDADHAGGLAALRDRYDNIAVLDNDLDGSNRCVRGMRWYRDGVRFEVLHPPVDGQWRGNDASCVLRVTAASQCVLLTGDIEARAELELASTLERGCAVVVGLHHGSKTSSSPAFVAAARADHVLFAAAFANRWGFPRPEVVSRWRNAGATVFDTGTSGAITVHFGRNGDVGLTRERCTRKPLWSPPPGCERPSARGSRRPVD